MAKISDLSSGVVGPCADMTPQEAWSYLEENLRQNLGIELNQIRKEQGLSQASLAEKIDATQPMLSRLFKGDDDRSPTLETLVKIAWGLNRYVEINLVSDIPSRSVLLPPVTDPALWPGVRPIEVAGTRHVQLKAIRLRKLEVESEAVVEEDVIPLTQFRYAVKSVIDGRHQGNTVFFVRMSVASRVDDKRNKDVALLTVKANLEATYQVEGKVSQEALEKLVEATKKQAPEHLWMRYRETLKVSAMRAGMPLSVIESLQTSHAKPPEMVTTFGE